MKTIVSSDTMEIPDGVKIKVHAKVIEVEGPRGKLSRNFKHLNLDFQLLKDETTGKRTLKIEAWFGSRKTSAAIRTALSHVENLITGVTKGYRYKMRFVYAHFPINASITNSNRSIEIRNFLGEKKVRKVDMLEGVTILRSEKVKDELVLDGNDIELVSRSAALINQKCHVKNKDIRKFLDGIYLSYAGMALISKAAFNEGMSPLVLNAYRQAIAAIVLAPFVFLLERTTHCSLSFGLFCKIFLAALCGPAASLDFYYMALRYTSATYGTAMLNTIPVVTFILSVLLRMETVGWSSFYGILKIVGMFKTVGGAMLLSFYRGPPLKNPHAPSPVGSSTETSHIGGHKNLIVGPVLMFLSSVAWSLWLIMQPKLLTQYPARLKLSTLQCLLSSVQSTVIAAALQRNFNSWKIGWDIQLASLAYCGILVTGFTYGLQVWCIEKKGPFYVAIFSPLSLLITAIFFALVWSEQLSWGSLLGGILVVGGLYSVLWGRSKEYNQLMLKSEPPSEKGQDIERD